MKQFILAIAAFSFSISAKCQSTDTSSIQQYSIVVCTAKAMSTKVTIDIDFGEVRKFFGKDTRVKDEEGKLKKFNGVVDALNYMGENGWQLVNAFPVGVGNVYHYVFKKTFRSSDIE